jgi:hypothetical protein
MKEAVDEIMNSKELIRFFARMLFHQTPSDSKLMFETFIEDLFPHKIDAKGSTEESTLPFRTQQVLKQLEYIFRQWGTDCK